MKTDLHIHTTESDGDFSPEEIIEKAVKAKLRVIAITDHDVVSGIDINIDYNLSAQDKSTNSSHTLKVVFSSILQLL